MAEFRVWAPKARRVDLILSGQDFPMSGNDNGWFSVDVDIEHGMDYQFRLDGNQPLPDPRSPWQPEGVDGPSRIVDHSLFKWTDDKFNAPPLSSAIVYEMHIGTFTEEGTFESAIDKLDHLMDLGVTHLELMPIAEFASTHNWGYDGVFFYAPHHAYGGPDGLKKLVNACHERGLAVILDAVYNHMGPRGNVVPKFGPYFTESISTLWGSAINYDGEDSEEVRRFILDNALMWLRDYHFDGLRLDAIQEYYDKSAMHILEQMSREVDELEAHLGRRLVLIAESDLNDPKVIRPIEAHGYGMDAQWSDDFHHSLHALLTGERHGYYMGFGPISCLAKCLREGYVFTGQYSEHRRRRHGRHPTGLSGHRFLAYLQTHDQCGNRVHGDRSGHFLSDGQVKIAAALIFTSPFIPMLFQGEEWATSSPFLYFVNFGDPELCKCIFEERRQEFRSYHVDPAEVPDPSAPDTFFKSKLNWQEIPDAPHAGIMEWHRRLIQLRNSEPILTDGRMDQVQTMFNEDAGWLTIERGPITVVVNFGGIAQRVPVSGEGRLEREVMVSEVGMQVSGAEVDMPPQSVAIFHTVARPAVFPQSLDFDIYQALTESVK